METISKIKMASEILGAMRFLGISSIEFGKLKKEHGGLEGLYHWISKQMESDY